MSCIWALTEISFSPNTHTGLVESFVCKCVCLLVCLLVCLFVYLIPLPLPIQSDDDHGGIHQVAVAVEGQVSVVPRHIQHVPVRDKRHWRLSFNMGLWTTKDIDVTELNEWGSGSYWELPFRLIGSLNCVHHSLYIKQENKLFKIWI